MVIADKPKSAAVGASSPDRCQNEHVADIEKHRYIDNGWPTRNPQDHPVSELAADKAGALSPFGSVIFPVPASELPYIHPVTVINR